MKKTLEHTQQRVIDVYGKAMDRVRSRALGVADQDVEFYNKLTPEQLTAIREKYGMDGLSRYVRAMEYRRMNGEKK